MAKILEFRPPAPKPLTPLQKAAEVLNQKQAIDEIVLSFLNAVLPKWVEHEWPFRELELLANDLRTKMESCVPVSLTRVELSFVIINLKPTWEELIREVNPSLFW